MDLQFLSQLAVAVAAVAPKVEAVLETVVVEDRMVLRVETLMLLEVLQEIKLVKMEKLHKMLLVLEISLQAEAEAVASVAVAEEDFHYKTVSQLVVVVEAQALPLAELLLMVTELHQEMLLIHVEQDVE